NDYEVISKAEPSQKTPPLHGRLTFIDHRANDHERHFCFRALQHSNAVALCSRFRAALTASGVSAKIAERKLIIIRRGPPPSGPKTKELFDAFRAAGGIEIDPSDADVRSFVALREMRDVALASSDFDAFERWLVARKPLCNSLFFKKAGLCPPPLPPWDGGLGKDRVTTAEHGDPQPQGSAAAKDADPTAFATEDDGRPTRHYATAEATSNLALATPLAVPPPSKPEESPPVVVTPLAVIPVGRRAIGGHVVELATNLLPRHTAIIAGAGSGKTVLLRR